MLRSAICGRGPTCGGRKDLRREKTSLRHKSRVPEPSHRAVAPTDGHDSGSHAPLSHGVYTAPNACIVAILVATGLVQATARYSGSACHHARGPYLGCHDPSRHRTQQNAYPTLLATQHILQRSCYNNESVIAISLKIITYRRRKKRSEKSSERLGNPSRCSPPRGGACPSFATLEAAQGYELVLEPRHLSVALFRTNCYCKCCGERFHLTQITSTNFGSPGDIYPHLRNRKQRRSDIRLFADYFVQRCHSCCGRTLLVVESRKE